MKKAIVLLSVFLLILTSCGSDDDSSTPDPLIGNWQYFKNFENGVEVALEDCIGETTLFILANGNFVTTIYDEDLNGNCIEDGSNSGSWENLGDGFYAFIEDSGTDTEQLFFEGNTFYIEFTDVFNGETFTDRIVYIRID